MFLLITSSILLTAALSRVVYKFYEEPFINLGKKILTPKYKVGKSEI
jgi:peptidoglycan/LPS O-acetylase OafA/YrhL